MKIGFFGGHEDIKHIKQTKNSRQTAVQGHFWFINNMEIGRFSLNPFTLWSERAIFSCDLLGQPSNLFQESYSNSNAELSHLHFFILKHGNS